MVSSLLQIAVFLAVILIKLLLVIKKTRDKLQMSDFFPLFLSAFDLNFDLFDEFRLILQDFNNFFQ